MRHLLLPAAATLCAIALPASPASAQFVSGDPLGGEIRFVSGGADVRVHRGDDGRHHGRKHRRFDDRVIVGGLGWYGGEWALYNNRSWAPDSYNDWWHERPDRAYPRWMSSNQNCERVWWGGGGWRC